MKTATLALLAVLAAAPAAAQLKGLSIGTASAGGTVFVYGGVIASLLTDKLGVPVSTQQTQGPTQNIILVSDKSVELGFTTMGAAWQGWHGRNGWTSGKTYREIRALFPMYDAPLHFVAPARGGIASLKDTAGKRVGLGPRTGSAGVYGPPIYKTLGIEATFRFGQAADMANQLNDGLIDAFGFVAGVPVAAFSELESQKEMNFFAFSDDEVARLRKEFPELSESVIPAGSYKTLKRDLKTVGNYSFAIAHRDLPEDLAYRVVQAVLEGNPRLVQGHAAARETLAQNWSKNTFLPFHSGAIRYYAEKGIRIPDTLR
jgi:TRAP transporter TAXI family solute receptor